MYLTHFGLARHPFRISPDPDLFYPGGRRGAILEALVYAITSGEGIIKVVGEVGSGKTMLCRMLEAGLPDTTEIVYLANPSLAPGDILYAIAFDLKLPVTPQSERLEVLQRLQSYLLDQHAGNRHVVVFVEEAQQMPLDTLEEIRLLSNLETSQGKLLQIVLFGQPELDLHLADRRIRQLKERITHSFRLEAFTPAETGDYIRFRLHTAGCGLPEVFSHAAVHRITRAAGGLTRRINILADKALLAAFAEHAYTVGPRQVRAAIRDSEFQRPLPLAWIGASAGAVAAVGVAGWLWWGGQVPAHIPAPAHMAAARSEKAVRASAASEATAPVPAAATPEEAPAPVAAAAAPPNKLLLEQRAASTLEWLARAEGSHYTIQLVTSDGRIEPLEALLTKARQAGVLDQVYVYRAVRGGAELRVVVYGEYPGLTPATAAIAELPEPLRAYRPFVRNVSAVLTEAGAASHRE